MNKALTKQIFGVPSLEVTSRIEDSDAIAKAQPPINEFCGSIGEFRAALQGVAFFFLKYIERKWRNFNAWKRTKTNSPNSPCRS